LPPAVRICLSASSVSLSLASVPERLMVPVAPASMLALILKWPLPPVPAPVTTVIAPLPVSMPETLSMLVTTRSVASL